MIKLSVSILLCFITLVSSLAQGGVGINNTGVSPNGSAMLDIVSSDRGLLIPRVALTGTTDITTIANGNVLSLLVFNTATVSDVTPGYYYWDGIVWKTIGGGDDADADPSNEIQDLSYDATTGILSLTDDGSTVDLTPIKDHDWYDKTSGGSPTNINDTIYTMGQVAIGKITPNATLDIVANTGQPALALTNPLTNAPYIGFANAGFIQGISNTGDLSIAPQRHFTVNTSGQILKVDQNGLVGVLSGSQNPPVFGKFYVTSDKENPGVYDSVLVFTEGGSLGIGKTVPTYKLHVEENADAQIGVGIWNPDNTGTNASEILILGQAGSNKYGYLGHFNDGYANGTYPNVTSNMTLLYGGGDIGITSGSTSDDITFGNALLNSRQMIIKGTGNVGIGTIAPANPLHIVGGAAPVRAERDGIDSWYWGINATRMNFTNGTTGIAPVTFERSGLVGIANPSPTETLDVIGTVKIVDGTEGAGKVFISDATGKGSWTNLFGTTWSNVTGSRALNTTYTNTSGKPLYVSVSLNHPGGVGSATSGFLVDGLRLSVFVPQSAWNVSEHTQIVPAGSSYSIATSGTVTLTSWNER